MLDLVSDPDDDVIAELEASLHRDDPAFVERLQAWESVYGVAEPPPPTFAGFVAVAVLVSLAAIVVTLGVAVVAGPNIGGLVGVVGSSAAGLVAYGRFRAWWWARTDRVTD